MKKALVTGITGQDGSYLAELLLGWQPTVTFDGLVEMVTKADLDLAAAETKPLR